MWTKPCPENLDDAGRDGMGETHEEYLRRADEYYGTTNAAGPWIDGPPPEQEGLEVLVLDSRGNRMWGVVRNGAVRSAICPAYGPMWTEMVNVVRHAIVNQTEGDHMTTRTHRALTRLEVDTVARGPVRGLLHLSGWHGRSEHDVEIVGETPKRYRVRLLETVRLPSRRVGQAGDVVLVPKYSITLKEQP